MSKSAVKLFRDPLRAAKAAEDLKSNGFKGQEIGIVVSSGESAEKLGATVTKDVTAALSDLSDRSEEAIKYYEAGLEVGGVLINVKADEARLAKAQEILKSADVGDSPKRFEMWSSSPAFPAAEKMSATNPIDAKMSGDFRKY